LCQWQEDFLWLPQIDWLSWPLSHQQIRPDSALHCQPCQRKQADDTIAQIASETGFF